MPHLNDWSIGVRDNAFTAPELMQKVAAGVVSGHSNLADGKRVTTSYIVSIDLENKTLQTRNTHYTLGRINSKYLAYLKENQPDWYKRYTKRKRKKVK